MHQFFTLLSSNLPTFYLHAAVPQEARNSQHYVIGSIVHAHLARLYDLRQQLAFLQHS